MAAAVPTGDKVAVLSHLLPPDVYGSSILNRCLQARIDTPPLADSALGDQLESAGSRLQTAVADHIRLVQPQQRGRRRLAHTMVLKSLRRRRTEAFTQAQAEFTRYPPPPPSLRPRRRHHHRSRPRRSRPRRRRTHRQGRRTRLPQARCPCRCLLDRVVALATDLRAAGL